MAVTSQPFIINMGPQHPSTHGVLRARLLLDGEVVKDIELKLGYLHRSIEKLGEQRTYAQTIPFTDRLDYMSSMSNNLSLCLAIEKLAGVPVPERAQYLRVIFAELQRLCSHAMAVGSFLNDLGAMSTPMLYMFREREKIMDLYEMACGSRLTCNYMRIGGVAQDPPPEFWPACRRFLAEMPRYIGEYEQLLVENEILIARTRGVGILPKELAIAGGVSGPMLRASGVKWDIRKADPYCVYDRMDFDIPTGTMGDTYDRFMVRMQEMRQSVRILEQALRDLPGGEVRTKVPLWLRPPAGEAYGHIESPKGELGFYLVSDGSINPYRFKIRSPSLINLSVLRDMVVGWKIADTVIILGSFDICLGEVDR